MRHRQKLSYGLKIFYIIPFSNGLSRYLAVADVVQFVALLCELQKEGGILGVRVKSTSVLVVGLLKSNKVTQSTGR